MAELVSQLEHLQSVPGHPLQLGTTLSFVLSFSRSFTQTRANFVCLIDCEHQLMDHSFSLQSGNILGSTLPLADLSVLWCLALKDCTLTPVSVQLIMH